MNPTSTETEFDLVASYSQAATYLSCERKYAYAYRDKWSSITASRPMTLGTVGHHMLDLWWTGTDIELICDPGYVAQYVFDLQETSTVEDCVSIAEHAIWLLRRYDRMYAKNREDITVLEVERDTIFELPQLGERRYAMRTKIDKLLNSPAHGGVIFMDHKFSGSFPKEDWLDIDPQISIYAAALRSAGIDVVCSFFDILYSYRNKKKGEFVEWDDPKYPVEDSFRRVMADRSDAMLDVVLAECYEACDRMWHLRQGNIQPIRSITAACMWCDFRAPCSDALQGDTASEQALLREHFDVSKKRDPVSVSSFGEEVEIG